MREHNYFISGVLQPDEVRALQRIYDHVVGQSWFDRQPDAQEAFAERLISLHRGGLVDFPKLRRFALLHAAKHYSGTSVSKKHLALELLANADDIQSV
ncbi:MULTISPECIES: hypothetical protein [unclassified Rhizobium]|uniref:hypothetical protein n=1 Tax=unclassified Rhizobium TaxID=2613769 RepID=UPI00380DE313